MLSQALTRNEWSAQGKPTETAFLGQVQGATDYLRLSHALLDGSACELEWCEVEGADHVVTVCCDTGRGLVHDLAAAALLRESWFYDWLPIDTRVRFEACVAT